MYSEKIMKVFYNPKNVGIIKGADAVGQCKNNTTAELIKFSVKLENNVISSVKFKAFGNGLLIAVASLTTQVLIGKQMKDLSLITHEVLLKEIGELPMIKLYCIDMVLEAINNLATDYRKKQEKLAKQLAKQVK